MGRGATELLQSFLLSTSKHLSLHDSQHTGRLGKRCIFKLDGFQSQLCHLLRLLLGISAVLWSAAEPALDGSEPVARPPAHDLYRSVHVKIPGDKSSSYNFLLLQLLHFSIKSTPNSPLLVRVSLNSAI